MKYKKFPQEFWDKISTTINALKTELESTAIREKLVAAFDADGTLWDTDLGENLFHYTIDQRLVPLPATPWDYYVEMKKENNDPRKAYLWLAQIYDEVPLEKVLQWAHEAVKSISPLPIFDEQKKLIELFLKENIDVYIVTASVKWAVIPGTQLLGLSEKNVIGIETQILNEKVTKNQKGVITYREGKSQALFEKTQKSHFFASGNTEGDLELLKKASHLKLAVSAANRDDKLFKTESELQRVAKEQNWLHHRFL